MFQNIAHLLGPKTRVDHFGEGGGGSSCRSLGNAQTLSNLLLLLGNFTSYLPQSIFLYVSENSKHFEQ